VSRTAFSFSRDLEFATEPELAKRMGCSRQLSLRAAVKELIDNSLDAVEEANEHWPEVAVDVDGVGFTVTDNGPGMSPELVEQLCIRSQRTSSREAYAAPDRGAQGNALQVIIALPLGLGCDQAITTITSRGVEHRITLRVNRLEQRIDLERVERPHRSVQVGTTVAMSWPHGLNVDAVAAIGALLDQHAHLNPHARLELRAPSFGMARTWAARGALTKWTPGRPVPAHWYAPDRFEHRVLLEIKRDPKITVAQFLGGFKGLTSRTLRSQVAAAADLSYQPLTTLLDGSGTGLDHRCARALLDAMQDASRPPKHSVLGAIGKEAFAAWAAANHASSPPQFLAYDTADAVVDDGVPVRWEIGVAHLPGLEQRRLLAGHNFSPAILPDQLAADVLGYAGWHFGANQPITLFLHRITPARQTIDYGKAKLGLGWSETAAVVAALKKIGKPWIKYATALDRGKRPPPPRQDKPSTFQDAAFAAMAEAYAAASSDGAYPVLSQQVFYKARPAILAATGKDELGPGERSRFCYVLLPQFMQDHAELTARWRVLYKPRGELIEPHTYRRVGLGTAEVAAYHRGWTNGIDLAETDVEIGDWEPETSGPHNRFGAVLIVEKGGIADVFRQVDLGHRHDLAIVGNEGQSVEAELRLVDALGPAGVPVFLLTDFDRQGFTIAENLRSGTWRHRYVTPPKVIHVGLRLDQITVLGGLASEREDDDPGGLEDEPIGEKARKHVSDDRLRECGATEAEIEVLATRRVELNALSSRQLVDLVEAALTEHEVEKVVPDAEDLAAAWRAAKARADIAAAVAKANKLAAKRWAKAEAPDDLADQVQALLEDDPSIPWDAALRQIAEASS
jgi:hypothetical protein